jgi:CheY-like chemotaxis protein
VALRVRDTGCGMSEEVKERIFEPFFSTRDVGRGTGLGLSVAHGIVASHSGAITVESAPGQGTTFNVYLPEAEPELDSSAAGEEAIGMPGPPCRILYVDDEESLLVAGKGLLERYGHTVTVKTDGAEALAAFREDPDAFDVVITDQTMPRLTGTQLARELRELRPELPVVITTGYSETIDSESARDLGAAAYLAKPFGARELVKVLREVLPEGRA